MGTLGIVLNILGLIGLTAGGVCSGIDISRRAKNSTVEVLDEFDKQPKKVDTKVVSIDGKKKAK